MSYIVDMIDIRSDIPRYGIESVEAITRGRPRCAALGRVVGDHQDRPYSVDIVGFGVRMPGLFGTSRGKRMFFSRVMPHQKAMRRAHVMSDLAGTCGERFPVFLMR